MNTNLTFFLLCPIPEEQKPMKEYLILQKNKVHKWFRSLWKPNDFIVFSPFLIFFSFFFCFFTLFFPFLASKKTCLFSFFLTWNFFFFLFFVLYIRWKTLFDRFFQARFFYEESSWYDGQIWEKPIFILKTDRFIALQKINPFLKGLELFFVFFSLLDFVFVLTFLF